MKIAADTIAQASELASNLISFSRHGALVKEKTNIATFIEENARFIARGHNLAVECFFSKDAGEVALSCAQFARVIHNLVINAAQAVDDSGGTLSISGKNLVLSEETGLPLRPGEYVRIIFKDNGPGIEAAHLPHIFEPYFTTKPMGNGLGLAIAYSVVTDHGGYMTAESKRGRGTTFYVYLPRIVSSRLSEKPP